jgi:hypothetical protein
MAAFELDKAQKSNPDKPITSAAQMKEANPLKPSDKPEAEDTPDAKVNELSSLLSMQKQKLESKLQQLTDLGALSRTATAPQQVNTPAATGAEGEAVSAGGQTAQAFDPAAAADETVRRQASNRLMRIKQQISKIENIMASLSIVKSVKMLDGILQAVAGAGALAGGADIAAAASSQDAPSSTASLNRAAARPADRKSAAENMISMIEESLRGMMVNLSA